MFVYRAPHAKQFAALFAQIRSLVSVNAVVYGELRLSPKCLVAHGTIEFGGIVVHSGRVAFHGTFLLETHAADVTSKRAFVRMSACMLLEERLVHEEFPAEVASETIAFLVAVNALVTREVAFARKYFRTRLAFASLFLVG